MTEYMTAFLVGGIICTIGQVLLDRFKLTPAHVLSSFVVAGAILEGFGLYDKLIDFAGAGATVPISSFGHSLITGAMAGAEEHGFSGIITGMFQLTSVGLSSAILFAFLVALVFRPKG
ncbi:MAG TPA: stage V sporulation protein AE [Bacillales bacterium]|nr:stage V sporulation protein AE [Bacillales bacterium]